MRSSGERNQKPIEQTGKPRSRKAKLEPVSHDTAENIKTPDRLKDLTRSIMENAYIAIALIDRNHKILMVNNAICKFFRKPVNKFIDQECFREFEKRESVCSHCPGKQAMETGQPAEIETEGIRDDGSHIPVRLQAFPSFGLDGAVTGFIEIIEDITERKKAEEALRESEQKYKDIFENAREAIITVDLDRRITEVNKLVEEYGFKREELIGKRLFDFIPEYDKARSVSDFNTLIGGDPVKGEMDVITPKGIATVEYRDNPIVRAGEVIGVQAILTDITDRKKAEQLLRKERDKAQKYLDIAAVMMVAIDSEHRVGLINRKGCEILGYQEEEILAKNWFDNFLPESVRDEVRDIFEKTVRGEIDPPEYYENAILTKSRQERLIAWHNTILRDEHGNVIAILSSGEDITKRKKVEEALRETTQTLQAVIQASPLPILALNRERIVKMWNPAAERTFGWGTQEVLGRQYPAIPKEKMDEADALFLRALESGLTEVETRRQRKDGSLIDVSISAAPLRDGRGNINGTMAVIADITERKRAEEALQRQEEELQVIFDSVPASILYKDKENRFIRVNRTCAELLGRPIEQIEGKSCFEIFPPDQAEAYWRDDKEIITSGHPKRNIIEPVETPKGTRLVQTDKIPYRNEKGNVIGVIGFAIDITERKKAEEALRESDEKVSQIVQENSVATFVIDANRVITHWNKACESLTGLPQNEMIGTQKQWLAFYSEKRPVMADLITDNAPEGDIMRHYGGKYRKSVLIEGAYEAEDFFPHLGEKGKWLFFTAAPLRDSEGKVTGAIETLQDITERKQVENKLLEDRIKLKSLASQLTLVEERERRRIAITLHDRISQSIVISKMKLDGLRNNFCSDDSDKVMEEVCTLLGKAIADIRSLTFELSSPILHELGFEAAVVAWLTEEIEKKYGIAVEFEEDKEPKPLDDDIKAILFRDVRELLINMVKHSKATKVKVSIRRVGDRIRVGVEDDGVGFDPAGVASRAIRNGRFGLFSIRERLEELGGRLEIESEPGHGCKVVMVAPLKFCEQLGDKHENTNHIG